MFGGGRVTGYAEVIPVNPAALLLPACRPSGSYRVESTGRLGTVLRVARYTDTGPASLTHEANLSRNCVPPAAMTARARERDSHSGTAIRHSTTYRMAASFLCTSIIS